MRVWLSCGLAVFRRPEEALRPRLIRHRQGVCSRCSSVVGGSQRGAVSDGPE